MKSRSIILATYLALLVVGWWMIAVGCTPAKSATVKQYGAEELKSDIVWMMEQKPCSKGSAQSSEISRNLLVRKIAATMLPIGGSAHEMQMFISIICKETGFNPELRSPAGAVGLAQVMPATAQAVADKLKLGKVSEKDLRDPEISVLLGYTYFLECVATNGGNLARASACYNGGPASSTIKAMTDGGRGVHETDNYVATMFELSERKRIADLGKTSH